MTVAARMRRLLAIAWSVSTGLTALTVVNALVLVVAIPLRLLDPTLVAGAPAWDKPIKFSLAFLAFGPTMLWIYSKVKLGRVGRIALELVGWSMVIEIVLIVMQAARGVMSHFNYSTVFDGTVFRVMAALTGVFALAALIVGVVLARRRLKGLLGLAITLSVPIMTLGAVQGASMTQPKPGQNEAGRVIVGGHTIGGPQVQGPGLPFLGWSTEHGDLRIAHFVGLHVLQILPLAALVLTVLASRGIVRANERRLRGAIWAGGAAYVGLIFTLYVQALRGQSIVAPDAFTVATTLSLVGLPLAIALTLVFAPRRRSSGSTPQPLPASEGASGSYGARPIHSSRPSAHQRTCQSTRSTVTPPCANSW